MSTNKQRTPHTTPTLDHVELDTAFEDAGGLSPAEYQKPAPSSFVPKTVGASQSLAVAVNTLVGVVRRNESQLLAALKPNDYQQLVEALEILKAIVGEDKNHFLTPLMDSIDALIVKCTIEIEEGDEEEGDEEKFNMKVQNYPLGPGMPKPHRPESVGRPATLPRVKLADLLAQDSDTKGSDDAMNIAPFRRHRPEKVGRPATLPRVKLADLLAQEADDTASEEIDTGPPVGNEVW